MKYKVQGQLFSRSDLELWCWDHLRYAPSWEKSHLLFMLQWLSRSTSIDVRTSGSTGKPKRITLSKKMMSESALITKELLTLSDSSKVMLALPSQFIAGKMMIVRALVNNMELQWIKPSADPYSDLKSAPDFIALTPMQVRNALISHNELFNQTGKVLVGGQQIDSALEDRLQNSAPECFETYGMTETSSHVAIRMVNGKERSSNFSAIPGITFSQDNRSCLVIHSESWFDEPLVTNDVVELQETGEFRWLGRVDHVINSGGVKIFPELVESKLRPILGQQRFIIHKEADAVTGEKVILYLERISGQEADQQVLAGKMKEVLSAAENPKSIYLVDKFEETETYKIIRKTYLS